MNIFAAEFLKWETSYVENHLESTAIETSVMESKEAICKGK